jgi:hypothetical protein
MWVVIECRVFVCMCVCFGRPDQQGTGLFGGLHRNTRLCPVREQRDVNAIWVVVLFVCSRLVECWLLLLFLLSLCASESGSSSRGRNKNDEELVVRRLLDRTGYVAPVPAIIVVVGVVVVSWWGEVRWGRGRMLLLFYCRPEKETKSGTAIWMKKTTLEIGFFFISSLCVLQLPLTQRSSTHHTTPHHTTDKKKG